MQIVNIGGGALLSSSFIKEKLTSQNVNEFFEKVRPYETKVGVGLVILGLIALLERLGVFYLGLNLGSSFPQAIPAIISGLLLGAPYFERFGFLKGLLTTLSSHKTAIGLITVACGLGSILFGCIAPICYPLYLNF